jgi:hypothetical protein
VGEATGVIQLTPGQGNGLASSPLTQPPQILARLGWAAMGARELPLTSPRPLDDVVSLGAA